MNYKYFTFAILSLAMVCIANAQTLKKDSATMGAGYANQIFYSMKTGQVGSASATNWDIAHTTDARNACIRANHIAGLMVFSYPKNGIAGWSTFDTAGWKTWKPKFNDIHLHGEGAFSLNSKHPKYGWATYNSTSHELIGDSLYLLAWTNGSSYVKFLKFWPVKQPTSTDLIFKFANVDGSSEVSDTLFQSAANNQNYKYYKFTGNLKPVREPNKANWDITFNRYYEPQFDPTSGKLVPYPTMGVESNNRTKVARLIGAPFSAILSDTNDLVRKNYPANFKIDLTAIGSDWKKYDQPNNKYIFKDTQSYIIQNFQTDTTYWLIHFTGFVGGSAGKTIFNYMQLKSNNVSVSNPVIGKMSIFPNPATKQLYMSLENSKVKNAIVNLNNLNGSNIKRISVAGLSDFNGINIPLDGVSPGIYMVSVQSGNSIITQKVIIE